MDDGSVPEAIDVCFWQVVDPDITNTFVYLNGNVAPITGYDIYAGTIGECINLSTYEEQLTSEKYSALSHAIFTLVFLYNRNSFYQMSSQPLKVCFCYQGPGLMCDDSVVQQSISVFPGQTFKVLAVGVGAGISPGVVKSTTNSKYEIFPELQSLGNACEPLNYTILAPENTYEIVVRVSVEGSHLVPGFIKYLNLMTLNCGFILQQLKCVCHPMLQRASVQCDINTQRFTRSGSVWIGMGSDEEGLLTHMYCPNAYCKLQETDLNLTCPDVQCAVGHSGVLCGSCKSGLALMLGSSKCQFCSNLYLLQFIFAPAAPISCCWCAPGHNTGQT